MSSPANGSKSADKKPFDLRVNPQQGNEQRGHSSKEVSGLAELLLVIDTIGATPIGKSPVFDSDVLDKLKTTPLYAAYVALKPVMIKILVSETTVEARSPWKLASETPEEVPQLKALEEDIGDISKAIEGVGKSMAKNDDIVARFRAHADKQNCNRDMILGAVTASEKETKGCVDSLRGELRKVNGTMGSGIGDLKRGLERLQKTLVDDAKGRITALQARITELEAQNEEMIRTLEITSGALLPLKEALEMAVHGEFGDLPEQEARPVDEEARKANETTIAGKTVDLIEMSQTIRQGVLRLSSQCGGLFSIIFPDPLSKIQEVESDFEGRWLKAMEAITDLRSEIRVKADRGARRAQHLQFYKFIIAQLREGRYSSILWGEALRGQSSAEFMSKDFGGFTTVQALAEDIQHLQTSLRV